MATKSHLQELGVSRDALFISDPTLGDKVVVGTIRQLEAFRVPLTADGTVWTTTHDLINTLDFETYGEDGFTLVLL